VNEVGPGNSTLASHPHNGRLNVINPKKDEAALCQGWAGGDWSGRPALGMAL